MEKKKTEPTNTRPTSERAPVTAPLEPAQMLGQKACQGTLDALRVPLVADLASTSRAALGTGPALTTALAVKGGAAAATTVGGGRRSGSAATAAPDGGSGNGELAVAAVDADAGVGVAVTVGTGEANHGAGATTAAAGDLDLHAADVVLRLADVGSVDTCNRQELVSREEARSELEL
jgi:hypothetical protein